MRIEALNTFVAVVSLTAVLCPRLSAANNLTLFSRRPREHHFRGHISHMTVLEEPLYRRSTYKEMQEALRQEGRPVDCCPMIEELVEPIGGRNREDMLVELYRNGEIKQTFYEYSCKPDILDKPCRFIDRKFSNQSRCVQKFSYTYAIIQDNSQPKIRTEEHRRHHHREPQVPAISGNTTSGTGWALDFIKVRSGCSCEIMPKRKKKKAVANKARKAKSKQHQLRDLEQET